MQGRHHEVPSHRRMKSSDRSIGITNLADENDIRILPKNRSKRFGKGQSGLLIDWNLCDSGNFVLDWIFNCDDIDRLLPNLIHERIERRRLSATGRTYC